MKTVYVVRGSEDGVIGVFSTPKKAWARLKEYVINADGGNRPVVTTYKEFYKSLKERGHSRLESTNSDFATADVERFGVNV